MLRTRLTARILVAGVLLCAVGYLYLTYDAADPTATASEWKAWSAQLEDGVGVKADKDAARRPTGVDHEPNSRPSPVGCSSDVAPWLALVQDEDGGGFEYRRLALSVSVDASTPDYSPPQDLDGSLSLPLVGRVDADADSLVQEVKSLADANPTIRVTVPPFPIPHSSSPPNASHLAFGLATPLNNLQSVLPAMAYWAADTGALIHVLVEEDSSSADIARVQSRGREMGLSLSVASSPLPFNDAYFSLVRVLPALATPATQWFAFLDDDTFFPSLSRLLAMLDTYPSPTTKPYYVGALTEDLHQTTYFGHMAYGGAGIFLSSSLTRTLAPHVEDCLSSAETGDARIARCIAAHTSPVVRLSPQPDLHQVDLHGDAAGFYESGRPPPLSLHHWSHWFPVDVVALGAARQVAGEDSLLRRWRLADGWWLTNGFSVVKYSGDGVDVHDETMEKTWYDWPGATTEDYLNALGPLREKDEEKRTYRLRSVEAGTGSLRQFYLDVATNASVIEVCWTLDG